MSNVNVTIRMDEDLKKQADKLFEDLGMSLTTAITVFTKQAVKQQGIPFLVSNDITNKETLEAIAEYQAMKTDKKQYKRYDSFDELLKDINTNA